MSHFEELIVYNWPISQKCSDCKFGEFISDGDMIGSKYQCTIMCRENDGIDCPGFTEKGEEDDTN